MSINRDSSLPFCTCIVYSVIHSVYRASPPKSRIERISNFAIQIISLTLSPLILVEGSCRILLGHITSPLQILSPLSPNSAELPNFLKITGKAQGVLFLSTVLNPK
jgi:hypothetical protein